MDRNSHCGPLLAIPGKLIKNYFRNFSFPGMTQTIISRNYMVLEGSAAYEIQKIIESPPALSCRDFEQVPMFFDIERTVNLTYSIKNDMYCIRQYVCC